MNLTKIELLWSRICPYSCAGCNMVQSEEKHQGTLDQWYKAIENFVKLGVQFVPIYGAEPLLRWENLPELLRELKNVNIAYSIITAIPEHPNLQKLIDMDLMPSLTVSWDGEEATGDRAVKSKSGLQVISEFTGIPDRAVTITVHGGNAHKIADMVKYALSKGIWVMLDIYHGSAGKYSKCSDGLQIPTRDQILDVMATLYYWKLRKEKIHWSKSFIEMVSSYYIKNPRDVWHCGGCEVGWLTVDADGSIYACDDWQIPYSCKIWDDLDIWELEFWAKNVVGDCPGCAWNTHFDACMIAASGNIGNYIHTKRKV